MKDKKDKRIFIKCVKPTICKHQRSDITEYHDGNYDIDTWCGLYKERVKCNQSTCKKKEYSGISYSEAVEKIAKALCADDVMREGYYEMAKAALNVLLEDK